MKLFAKYSSVLLVIFTLVGFLYLHRDFLVGKKILFPSNFLAHFYSPWSTTTFAGWEAGIPNKPIGDDQIRIFYPSRIFTNEMFAEKQLPLWNPYIFAGTPHLADFQSAVFYPFTIIYAFLPTIVAWSILMFIQPVLAGLFMGFFLHRLKQHPLAIVIGSVAFGLSGFMTVWSQENVVVGQAALWLPLVLYGIESFVLTEKRWFYLITVLALTHSFLAGFFQVTFYIFSLSFIYGIFRLNAEKKLHWKNIAILSSMYLFALTISAIQLFPSLEAFGESPRSIASAWYLFKTYLLPITHVLTLLTPDMFGNPGAYNYFGRGFYRETIVTIGTIPVLFAAFACLFVKRDNVLKFFIFTALITFLLSVDSPFTRTLFHLPLPLLPTFLPSRVFILTSFSLSVLASMGLTYWVTDTNKLVTRKLLLLCGGLIILLGICLLLAYLLTQHTFDSITSPITRYMIQATTENIPANNQVWLRNTLIPFFMLCLSFVLLLLRNKYIAAFSIGILIIIGQLYFFNKYKVLGEPQFLYPKHETFSFLSKSQQNNRFISFGQPIHENASTVMHTYSIEGVNPIFPKRYGQLLYAVQNDGKITNDIPRVEARLSEIGEHESPYADNRRSRLLSLLGVSHLLTHDKDQSPAYLQEKFPEKVATPVWKSQKWQAYHNRKVFPRAYFVDSVVIESDDQKIIDTIFHPSVDLRSTVILEKYPKSLPKTNARKPERSPETSAIISSYTPQNVVIETNTDIPRMLFLSDNYYPGWKAYIDKKPTEIYRADFTFRAVVVPSGKHTVTFRYDPLSVRLGMWVSVLALFLWVMILVSEKAKEILRKKP